MSTERTPMTEIVFILDRSGSMQGLEADTIGGFNGLIEKQRHEPGEALVTTVLFDDRRDTIYDRVPIAQIEPLTNKQYYARGCTALLDAVGSAICSIERAQRHTDGPAPAKTLVAITTDGLENASKEFTLAEVRRLIERKEEEGWEFLFLGANIDAIATAATMGIPARCAAQYVPDAEGTSLNFEALNQAVCCARMEPDRPMSASWKERVERRRKRA